MKEKFELLKEKEGIYILLKIEDKNSEIKSLLKDFNILYKNESPNEMFFELKYYNGVIEKLKAKNIEVESIPKFTIDGIKKTFDDKVILLYNISQIIKWSLLPKNIRDSLLPYQKECVK
jgi:hypothetical protein